MVIGWFYEVGCGVVIAKIGYILRTGLVKTVTELVIGVKNGRRVGYTEMITQSSMCCL